MKVVKIVGLVLLVLVIVFLILGIVVPGDYLVEREITIDAPPELVFQHVKYWKNWHEWSPWAERDSTMEVTVEGEDGKPNSVYRWRGDPDITGSGEMIASGIEENEDFTYQLYFKQPWESQSNGYTRLIPSMDGTTVVWGFEGVDPFPWNVVMLFMNIDSMVGPDFERGLELLKEVCENEMKIISGYDIKAIEYPGATYVGIRDIVPFENVPRFFDASFARMMPALQKTGAVMTGAPAGMYFTWEEKSQQTDMAVAMMVDKPFVLDPVTIIEIPASTGYCVDHYGPYVGLKYAHMALGMYFQENDIAYRAPAIEEYVSDPEAEPDSTKWLTKVTHLVGKRGE